MRSRSTRFRRVAAGLAVIVAAGLVTAGSSQALSGGTIVPDGTFSFLARITSEGKGCTGSLIDPSWVITAASCLPATGLPKVAVGNLATATAAKAVRHTDRDVAVIKLASPATGITPIALGTTPASGAVRVAGLGRTTTDWVPARPRVADFTVAGTTAGTVALTSTIGVDTCKGDAGGPTFREVGGQPQLVAVNKTSWQHGCLLVTETRQGSTSTRTDDLGDWIRRQIVPTPVTCTADAVIWAARPDGTLHRYYHHQPADGGLNWTIVGQVGSGWTGRPLAGPGGVLWDIHRRQNGSDPSGDGVLNRWVWTSNGWTQGGQVGSGWDRYLTPDYRNRITVDERGRIINIDDQGLLRYYEWNTAANTWVNGGGVTLDTGWQRFDSITAAGDGVLYARTPGGELFRFKYDFATGTWAQRDKPAGAGWQMFREIFSPGGDILYGRGSNGVDPWTGAPNVPVLRWYRHYDNTDTWAPGAADGTGKSVGTGWNTELHVTAEPNACRLQN